jgi:ubiquinone/menaquinone biosynthesis C-methylase UbiE
MGFYTERVLPRILDLTMASPGVAQEREKGLAAVRGRVLEVGFGSGLNLPFYPPQVERVVAVEPSRHATRLAHERIAAAPFPVEIVLLAGEHIDVADATFDSVVCTFTLCTVADPAAALAEIRRVLRRQGRLFFVEHGRAPDAKVRRWQDRLNGLQKALVGGCHLNRDVVSLIGGAGFALERLEQRYLPGHPRPYAFVSRGIAR